MEIYSNNGINILKEWYQSQCLIRAELISGNVSLSFTGTVQSYSTVEIILFRKPDKMSVSLFYGSHKVIEPDDKKDNEELWKLYWKIVQVETDAGAQCTFHELR